MTNIKRPSYLFDGTHQQVKERTISIKRCFYRYDENLTSGDMNWFIQGFHSFWLAFTSRLILQNQRVNKFESFFGWYQNDWRQSYWYRQKKGCANKGRRGSTALAVRAGKKLCEDEIVELLPQKHSKNRIKFPSTEDTLQAWLDCGGVSAM